MQTNDAAPLCRLFSKHPELITALCEHYPWNSELLAQFMENQSLFTKENENLHKFIFSENILIKAHKHCIRNRDEILVSELCGCFYCLSIYTPGKISEWLKEDNDSGYTALCSCGVDALIGSASNFPITSEFMKDMHARWFSVEE